VLVKIAKGLLPCVTGPTLFSDFVRYKLTIKCWIFVLFKSQKKLLFRLCGQNSSSSGPVSCLSWCWCLLQEITLQFLPFKLLQTWF